MNFIFFILIGIISFTIVSFVTGKRRSMFGIMFGLINIAVFYMIFNGISNFICTDNYRTANTTYQSIGSIFCSGSKTVGNLNMDKNDIDNIPKPEIKDEYVEENYNVEQYRYNKSETLNTDILNDNTLLNLGDI